MLALLLSSLFAVQDPAPAPEVKPPAPVATPRPVQAWDDRTAKTAVDEFQKATKGSVSMAAKNQALEALATGSHKLLVKPLAQVVENDKSLVIRKRAAALLAQQPAADATPMILALLKNSKVTSTPTVQAELVHALAATGYKSSHWGEVDSLFERDFAPERIPLQEAILKLAAQHKEKQAIKLLLRHLDEPSAENVDDASNPPAEYWEARWKAWSAWRNEVRETLFAITGQRFSTAAEAKAWLAKNPLK